MKKTPAEKLATKAAKGLEATLPKGAFVGVSIAHEVYTLVVWTNLAIKRKVPKTWEGYSVVVRGVPRPL